MLRKTNDCFECGESVPYGRLTCSACGSLLASVAGGRGQPEAVATPPAVSATPADPIAPLTAGDAFARAEAPRHESLRSPWPPLTDRPEPILLPRPYREPGIGRPARPADPDDRNVPLPGAYRPPALALATAGGGAIQPSWPGPRVVANRVHSPAAGKVADAVAPAATHRSDDAVADRFVEIAAWFVIVGASLAVLGFLLPWSLTVIGSSGFGGYFDNWGLASPSHLFVLLGLLVVLALGVLQTPVPAWFGTGVLGLVLGGLLIGLVWPYLVGPLGADLGVIIVGLGGLALATGGALASRATRHGEADPVV